MKKGIVFIIFVFVIALATVIILGKDNNNKDREEKIVKIEIAEGSSAKSIADKLYEKEIIDSKRKFLNYIEKEKLDQKLKPGEFKFHTSMTLEDVVNTLTKQSTDIVNFTIPEGYEIRQIADLLSKENILNKKKFKELATSKKYVDEYKKKYYFLENVDTLEGFLFPDTYTVSVKTPNIEDYIINMMLNNFDQKLTPDLVDKGKNLGMNIKEIVTMASIIEREAVLESERELISGVFQNRIRENMKLESCATVQYIIEERKPVLSYSDVKIDSPFNTYMYTGLPPSPIASPGLSSLKAAVNPKETNYKFFVAKGDGSHIFSETYEEHIKAQDK